MLVALLLACAGGDSAADTADSGLGAPTLTNVQAQVFTPSCAFSGCHGEGKGSANLSLQPGVAYAALVGVPSDGDPTQTRVVPGDADASYLVMKLEGAEGIVGDGMPDGVPLEAERIQLVRDWISEGAQDN